MKPIGILAGITFLEGIRDRFFHGLLFIALLILGANLVLTQSFTYDLGKVAVDVGLSATAFFGLVIIFFMGINLIAKDLDKLTIYMVLSRPISRWQYVLGKFFGLSLILLAAIVLLGAISAISVVIATAGKEAYVPENFSWSVFGIALAYQYVALNLITAFTLFYAVITSSSFIAMLLSLFTYFICQNIELLLKLLASQPYFENSAQIELAITVLSWVFPNLAAFDLKTSAAYGLSLDPGYLAWTLVHGVAYTGILLVFASLIFHRRELA